MTPTGAEGAVRGTRGVAGGCGRGAPAASIRHISTRPCPSVSPSYPSAPYSVGALKRGFSWGAAWSFSHVLYPPVQLLVWWEPAGCGPHPPSLVLSVRRVKSAELKLGIQVGGRIDGVHRPRHYYPPWPAGAAVLVNCDRRGVPSGPSGSFLLFAFCGEGRGPARRGSGLPGWMPIAE